MDEILAIYGKGGHGNVAFDTAKRMGFSEIVFYDDNNSGADCRGNLDALLADKLDKKISAVFVAIGNSEKRREIFRILKDNGIKTATLIDSNAVVSESAKIGEGTIVVANATVNAFAEIGEGCIINTNSSVDHNVKIGAFSHICPGSNIAGGVSIGENSWIGIGSCAIQGVKIGDNVYLGTGSVVVAEIPSNCKAYGCPAKIAEKM